MMIICPACGASHVQGTLFCEQCGTSLLGITAVEPVGTASPNPELTPMTGIPLAASFTGVPSYRPSAERAPAEPGTGKAPPSAISLAGEGEDETPSTMPLAGTQERETGRLTLGSVPTRLRVLVLNTGRLTDWIEDPVIHVGRTDRSANVFPNIDLETDGGHNAGVSRRHVRIIRQQDGYYLEDLGSINGSFLNRRRLSPGNPTELKDGDEVRLGNIVLRIVLGGFQRTR